MIPDYRKDIISIFIWSTLNIITSQTPLLACAIALIEHLIIISLLTRRKYYEAFKYFLIFVTISLEISAFITGSNLDTYTFFNVPILHGMLNVFEVLWLYFVIKPYSRAVNFKGNCLFLNRWINILFITGIISGFITMLINDNNVLYSGNYPKTFFLHIIGFIGRFCFYQISLVYICCLKKYNEVSYLCSNIFIALIFSSVIMALCGYQGYYGEDKTMLSSLAMGLSPCLLLVSYKGEKIYNTIVFISVCFAIISSFFYPSVIGSKWYLVLFLVIICYASYVILGKQSPKLLFTCGVLFIAALPLISDYVLSIVGTDSYIGYKLRQSFGILNFKNMTSAMDFMGGMGQSPMFRFDELHNIFIEHLKKPFFSVFGKGYGGTTLHHTDLLSWETAMGAFSDDEIRMNAYHTMHETLAQVFLTHGFLGIFFVFSLLYRLFKSYEYSGWAIMGFLFIFFYWNYGMSFSIGTVAVVLSLYQLDNNK